MPKRLVRNDEHCSSDFDDVSHTKTGSSKNSVEDILKNGSPDVFSTSGLEKLEVA